MRENTWFEAKSLKFKWKGLNKEQEMDSEALEGVEHISLGPQVALKFVIKKIYIVMDMVDIDFCRPFFL